VRGDQQREPPGSRGEGGRSLFNLVRKTIKRDPDFKKGGAYSRKEGGVQKKIMVHPTSGEEGEKEKGFAESTCSPASS